MKEVVIATWNISECIATYWDIKQEINYLNLDKMQNVFFEITEMLNKHNIDIVCFQEFPINIPGTESLIDYIKNNTVLQHNYSVATCPSFLFEGGMVGISLFSKKELHNTELVFFTNPNLTTTSETGKVYRSFDKGFLVAECVYHEKKFSIVTGHSISFSPFGVRAENYPESYIPLLDKVEELYDQGNEIVVAGDFNTECLLKILPQLNDYLTDAIQGATTPIGIMEGKYYPCGRKLDYFLSTSQIVVYQVDKIQNFSDHYLCVCHCIFT